MTIDQETFTAFLAASAAGGATAPVLALIAQELGGGGQVDVERFLSAANELADAAALEGPEIRFFDPVGQYTSCANTVVTATDCGPMVRINVAEYGVEMTDAPDTNYRVVAANGINAPDSGHVCGEGPWSRLARLAQRMAELSTTGTARSGELR